MSPTQCFVQNSTLENRRLSLIRRLDLGVLAILMVLCLASQSPASAQERGYKVRACGLDMNRNGILGEPAGADPLLEPGDCNVCDGGPSHPTHPATGTPDPDGDGVDEDLIYIDAQNGSDTSGTGSALDPFRTIGHAWSVADGISNGVEDILCFRGTSNESSLTPPMNFRGLEETYVVPASGSESRDWHFPSQPTMLVGWDRDDDGCYPPFDNGTRCGATGDVAVLNGNFSSSIRTFHLDRFVSYLEMAHFSANDYGRLVPATNSGFIKFSPVSEHDYLYFHDIETHRINGDRSHDSDIISIDLFTTNLHWVNFNNMLFHNNGGWFVRGVPHQGELGESDAGPLRWQNISRIIRADDGGAATSFKPWGYITGGEILDSVWDLNTDAWTPLAGTGFATITFVIVQCLQDWVIRNNEVIDFWTAVRINGSSDGACDENLARPTTDIVVDRNVFRNTYPSWDFGHIGILVKGENAGDTEGDAPGEVVGDVVISNNFVSSVGGNTWEACIGANPGNDAAPVPGQIQIVANTCVGPIRRDEGAGILIGSNPDGAPQLRVFMQQDYLVKNNIVTDLNSNDHNMVLGYVPSGLDTDHNVYDGVGRYALWVDDILTGTGDLAAWRTTVSGEGSSRVCEPQLVSRAAGDFHLAAADTCAVGMGANLSFVSGQDIDGAQRPASGPWDIGADERTPVFADGFEIGSTINWGATTP